MSRSGASRMDVAARNQRAKNLVRARREPGAHLYEINASLAPLEPCQIETLRDFHRALGADGEGLFGTLRARCVGEAA